MKALLETFARGLVSAPDRVFVDERSEGQSVCLELRVAPEDRGRVIGREGSTADSLRTVLDAVARRRGQRCRLEIVG